MSPNSNTAPFDTYRIFQIEEEFAGLPADLLASWFEIDVPDTTIASGYKSHRLRGEVLRQLVAGQAYRLLDVATAQAMADDPDQIQFIRYRIQRGTDGDVETYGLPTDQAHNRPGAFAAEVDWQNPATGQWERKLYAASTNTVRDLPEVWQVVGDPANRNYSLGAFDASNSIGASTYGNNFGLALRCDFGTFHLYNRHGLDTVDSVFAGPTRYNTFGDLCSRNQYGAGFENNRLGTGVTDSTFGDNVQHCVFGPGCYGLQVGDHVARVQVYNSPRLVIPAGTTDAVYRNGQLVTAGAQSGPALRAGTVIRFDVHEAVYGPTIGGTFTVDVTGAQPGYTVRADLDPTSTAIALPSSGFKGIKNVSTFVSGAWNIYIFCVGPDGIIDYTIAQRS